MTNPNDYISPTTMRQIGENEYRVATQREIQEGIYLFHKPGLTKREYFSAMAMQGLLASNTEGISMGMVDIDGFSGQAVRAADSLINALNQQQ